MKQDGPKISGIRSNVLVPVLFMVLVQPGKKSLDQRVIKLRLMDRVIGGIRRHDRSRARIRAAILRHIPLGRS